MKNVKKAVCLLLIVCFAISLTGCKSGNNAKSDPYDHITIGIPQDLNDSLDPHMVVGAATKEINFNIFEGLVKPDSDGNLIPAVAESYDISEDGLTYTFTLRDNVKFHNGEVVSTDDVLFCIDKNKGDGSSNPLIPAFSNIGDFSADGKNIIIKLATPDPDFLQYMTMAIIPKSNENPDSNPIGTGPYTYVSRSPQENIILKKFDEYWGTPAYIENVTLKICSNADTIVMDLKGGSVDLFARITSAQAMQLQNTEFNILEGTMNLVQALYLNHTVVPFDDIRVRQALCYAVDPQEIIDLSFDGKGTVIGSSMFPAFGKYYIEETKDTYPVDLEKAKALLTEAGYPNGFSFEIKVPSNYQPHIDTAQVVVEQLKKIGVNAEIKLVEWDTWVSDVYTGRNFEATLVGVDASTMTARALLERFTTESPKNFINFDNSEYDRLFKEALSTVDDAKQTELYKQCEWILTNEAANVYIQDLAEMVAINKKYTGYTFYPIYVLDIAKIKPVD